MQKPGLPKGTRDFGPEKAAKRRYLISAIESVFKLYGFSALETPALENLSVLTGKYGDEGDQLLFKVLNSGDYLKKTTENDFNEGSQSMLSKISEKGLRYDLTVPFARFVVMNQHQITFPFKRYQIQPVWRADRPQKGRYREFYQCDADIIGSNNGFQQGWNEIELTLMIRDVFEKLNFSEYVIKLNHREILFGMAAYVGMKGKEIPFCVSLDKLDKIGEEAVLNEVAEQGGDSSALKSVLEILQKQKDPTLLLDALDSIITEGKKGFEELSVYLQHIQKFNVQIELDFSLARGLSYYTGMIFEVKPTSVQMGSICGGGRYDDLTGIFGLPNVSGVGISFGLDRIYDVLEELELFPSDTTQTSTVLITHFGNRELAFGMELIAELRKNGIKSELYPDTVKIKKQFQYADKKQIPYVITIGEEEMESGKLSLKQLESGNQEKLTIEEIIEKLSSV